MRRARLARLAVWAVALGGVRLALVPPADCGETSPSALAAAIDEAAGWLVRAQERDGRWVYLYDRRTGEQPGYNLVRHAGVTMSLFQLAAQQDRSDVLPAADAGVAWLVRRLHSDDGWSAVREGDRARLGTNALLLAALHQRRLATGDERYDALAVELGEFILRLQQRSGAFLAEYDLDAGAPVPGLVSLYATGEAFWALAQLDEAQRDTRWEGATRAVSRYLATARDEVEETPFPPWADQWAAYGLDEVWWELSDAETHYARTLARRFGLYARSEAIRESNSVSRLAWGGHASGSGLGVEVEGLASLWRLAGRDRRLADLQDVLEERARCAAGILVARQATGDDPLVRGAWFKDGVTRMDDQQHALSGLVAVAAMPRG